MAWTTSSASTTQTASAHSWRGIGVLTGRVPNAPIDSRQASMDPLLLCGVPRLSLYDTPTVSPCGEPHPIGADAPSLLCGAPSIMLRDELQPLGADMPILICGAEAPCAKGLLNPGDDAQHGVVHRVVGKRLGLDGLCRLLIFLVEEVDGRGDTLVGGHAWKRVDVL